MMPNFNTDELNRFTVLGEVQHRGLELSLSSTPGERLNLLFGAVIMQPRVTGQAVADGRVGERPLGQPETMLRFNVDYRPAFMEGLSVDASLSGFDERPSSRDNFVMLPSYALLDLGARYRFTLGTKPATLRVQLANVTDEFVWSVTGSNSYGFTDRRRLSVLFTMDL